MTNLVIGSTSQLAQYFPDDYVKVSSRNIDFDYLKHNQWDAVYITFAEQSIYNKGIDYITPNYLYTMQIINSLLESSNKIVCYTSCELWNNLAVPISITTPPNFFPLNNEYAISKLLLLNKVMEFRKTNKLYEKVLFMHPFYFNSIHRKSQYFLFGKIFYSIINEKQIEVNNISFYRDCVHPSFVVKKSIEATQDTMVGSGKLFNMRDFIKDLYKLNNMDFDYFVKESNVQSTGKEKLMTADINLEYSYDDLLKETQNDILIMKGKV